MTTITINPGANIQDVINSAPSGSTVVFTPGTYNVSEAINLKSGVSLEGQSGAKLVSDGTAGIFEGHAVQNVTISGFVLDGHNGGPGQTSGAIYLDSATGGAGSTPSDNIHILNNTFQNWTNSNALTLWSTQNTYIEGNTIKNGYQGITWDTISGTPPLNNLVISGNSITGMSRMGIETGFSSTVSNVHIDYNTLSNIKDMGISFVEGDTSGNFKSGTVWGNHIDGSANSGNVPLLEIGNRGGTDNITVAQNDFSNSQWGLSIGHVSGMAILNNNFTNVQNPYSVDGGYDGTEWIGSGTIDGVHSNGWSDHGSYGAQPALYSPSTLLSGVNPVGTAATTAFSSTSGTSGSQTTTGGTTDPSGTTTVGTGGSQTTTSGTTHPSGTTAAGTGGSQSTTGGTTDPSGTTTAGAGGSQTTTGGTSDPLSPPIHSGTVFPGQGHFGGFLHGSTNTSQASTGGGVASTGSGSLNQATGGHLSSDLTNFWGQKQAPIAGSSPSGSGTQTQPLSGIGAAFSNQDYSSRLQNLPSHDTWSHS